MLFAQGLREASAISSANLRVAAYESLTNSALELADPREGGRAILDILAHLSLVDTSTTVARDASEYVAKTLLKIMEKIGMEEAVEVMERALVIIDSQPNPWDKTDEILRQGGFDYLVDRSSFIDAANLLAGLVMDSPEAIRVYSDTEKAEVYIKIAEAYLHSDETGAAENYLGKAGPMMHNVTHPTLLLRYRASTARALDANRKFLDASFRYYELSQMQMAGDEHIDQHDLLELMARASTCAILGKAGPQRNRILSMLYKDERLRSLERIEGYSTHAQILTKMYMEQIVSMHEMETFEKGLMEHQKAQTGNGLTIPTRAVIEHNLVAASSIYDNVYFEELGRLLDINPDQAERMIAQMISEGRLSGSIDQVSGLVQFELQVEKLHRWDDRIADACNQLNSCVIDVVSKYPDFERALYTST